MDHWGICCSLQCWTMSCFHSCCNPPESNVCKYFKYRCFNHWRTVKSELRPCTDLTVTAPWFSKLLLRLLSQWIYFGVQLRQRISSNPFITVRQKCASPLASHEKRYLLRQPSRLIQNSLSVFGRNVEAPEESNCMCWFGFNTIKATWWCEWSVSNNVAWVSSGR